MRGMTDKSALGHLLALITIVIWGTTFISTKVLLAEFQPVEILMLRFAIALPALWLMHPGRLRGTTLRQELTFAAAGLCGICLYYLLENIALTYTSASNVGIIVSASPFFTALLAGIFQQGEERLTLRFFLGFAVAIVGISLISLSGHSMQLNPLGDLLALLGALVWAIYSILIRKIETYGYPTIQTTRRCFFYGILFMLPALGIFGFAPRLEALADATCLANMLYLGLGASALCFVTWGLSVKLLGVVQTSIYLYAIPIITVLSALLILHEQLTPVAGLGIVLTLAGLGLSSTRKNAPQTSASPDTKPQG